MVAIDVARVAKRDKEVPDLVTPGGLLGCKPEVHRAAYQQMLHKFITVADLLQPGAGYGTTPQDYVAWYDAMRASNITVW